MSKLVYLDENAHVSFSQFSEDLFLDRCFFAGQDEGFYVDIGCHHPFRLSNTAIFYARGWSGLNVDLDPRALDLFNAHRPRDINVLSGVGGRNGRARAFLFNEGAVNTISAETAEAYRQIEGRVVVAESEVDTLTVQTILETYLPPGQTIDFMSIDVEGLDMEAARSNDWNRFRPRVVIAEVHGTDLQSVTGAPIVRFMDSVGYSCEALLGLSAIFGRRD